MNQTQTDTPLTDAAWNELEHYEPISALANELYELARRLERDLAKANADKAMLVEALDTFIAEGLTLIPRLSNLCRANVQACIDKARAALSQVQA